MKTAIYSAEFILSGGRTATSTVELTDNQLDFLVHVDRSGELEYPERTKRVLDIELERSGPEFYNLRSEVHDLIFEKQAYGWMKGHKIYSFLKGMDLLPTCLNLQDGYAIKEKGILVFRALYKNCRGLFLWASVVEDMDGKQWVPKLREVNGSVQIMWHSLNDYFDKHDPALCYKPRS